MNAWLLSSRRLAGVVLITTLLLLGRPPAADAGCLLPPVRAPVADPFRAPLCTYCPGNRGIEYDTAPGMAVLAAGSGMVTFSGTVAATRFVVIRHADGRRATYGFLATAAVASGQWVRAGDAVGTASERLYFGLREGERYVDPAPLLGVLRFRPRLVPVDWRPGRSPPPPALHCPAEG